MPAIGFASLYPSCNLWRGTPPAKKAKKKGATGITTVAPLVAGQWGRGDNRLPG
jgi:hypothetical protein